MSLNNAVKTLLSEYCATHVTHFTPMAHKRNTETKKEILIKIATNTDEHATQLLRFI